MRRLLVISIFVFFWVVSVFLTFISFICDGDGKWLFVVISGLISWFLFWVWFDKRNT